MCLATQSPSDVLESSISRTLVEQTPTKIFFPNSDANYAEYTEGFGLTEREFRLIKEQLEPGSRMFLVKQSHHSVVCQLDLKGFDAELAVISGRATQVARMNEIMATLGADPEAWLPSFMAGIPKPRDRRPTTSTFDRRQPCSSVSAVAYRFARPLLAAAPAARAQWAVVDVGAIDQLIQEVQTMSQQLISSRRRNCNKRKNTLQSMTGGSRHADSSCPARPQLSPDQLADNSPARSQGGGSYPGLAARCTQCGECQCGADAARSSLRCRRLINSRSSAARQTVALRQALAQEALANSSSRFAASRA